ncbi:MAG: hypothetical protein ACR2L3_06475 [Actinomycetota bacterium]
MAELPSDTNPKPPAVPGWVKVLAIIATVVIVVMLVTTLLGKGGHGPGRHMENGTGSGQLPAALARF